MVLGPSIIVLIRYGIHDVIILLYQSSKHCNYYNVIIKIHARFYLINNYHIMITIIGDRDLSWRTLMAKMCNNMIYARMKWRTFLDIVLYHSRTFKCVSYSKWQVQKIQLSLLL